jgi:hypothetical protein
MNESKMAENGRRSKIVVRRQTAFSHVLARAFWPTTRLRRPTPSSPKHGIRNTQRATRAPTCLDFAAQAFAEDQLFGRICPRISPPL